VTDARQRPTRPKQQSVPTLEPGALNEALGRLAEENEFELEPAHVGVKPTRSIRKQLNKHSLQSLPQTFDQKKVFATRGGARSARR
jgi:hypothetical protein